MQFTIRDSLALPLSATLRLPTAGTAVAGGCLAGTAWFAVYGLTGGFRNLKSPNVNVGYDHYPVRTVFVFHAVKQSVRGSHHR